MIAKILVLRAVGHHLPAELVDHIHGSLLDLHHLPRPTELHAIWAPKPKLAQCSKTVRCAMKCDLTCPVKLRLKWAEMERRFIYYHGYNPRPCRFQPCENHHPPLPDGEYDEETFHPALLEALELSIDDDGLLSSSSVFVAFVITNLTEKVVAISHQSAIFS